MGFHHAIQVATETEQSLMFFIVIAPQFLPEAQRAKINSS
jgi:hypothetical protein